MGTSLGGRVSGGSTWAVRSKGQQNENLLETCYSALNRFQIIETNTIKFNKL